MDRAVKKELTKQLPKVWDWWITNARLRHGHLPDEPAPWGIPGDETATPGPAGKVSPAWLLALLGPLATAAAAWWLWPDPATPTNPTTPTVPPAVSTQDSGSLYQYLEDQGAHVPEGLNG